MSFASLMHRRYTCKHYSDRKVPAMALKAVLEAGRLSPSAVNLQPWKFLVIQTEEGKAKIADSIMETNATRFASAPVVIVLCSQAKATDAQIEAVLDKEEQDGRFPDASFKEAQRKGRTHFVNLHRKAGDEEEWNARQVYIAMASMLYAADDLGLDATPVEGYWPEIVDEKLQLHQKGLKSQLLIFLGYRDPEDSNQLSKRPKSRLSYEDVVEYLD